MTKHHHRIALFILILSSTSLPVDAFNGSRISSVAVTKATTSHLGRCQLLTGTSRSSWSTVKRKTLSSPMPSSRKRSPPSSRHFTSVLHESLRERGGDIGRRSNLSIGASTPTPTKQHKRWHKRLFSKLLLRSSSETSSSSAPLRMTAVMDEETETLLESLAAYSEEQQQLSFVLRNFDSLLPQEILPETLSNEGVKVKNSSSATTSLIDSEFYDVHITPSSRPTQYKSKPDVRDQSKLSIPKTSRRGSLSVARLIAGRLENILASRIANIAMEEPEDFAIQVEPLDNSIRRLFLRGHFRANATISSGRLVFQPIRFSKGSLQLEKVTLNLLGFLQKPKETSSSKEKQSLDGGGNDIVRYPKQFDLHVKDLTMSRHDLLFSPCIKNGLRRLLINILKDRGVQSSSIQITSIDILPSGKISCSGDAKTHFGSQIPFELRSGISHANRGHVLTFPGLEVSLNRDFGLFVPVVPTIDLDVGHNAQFRRIHIDGARKEIQLDATVTITPDRTIRLMQHYVQNSQAFAARFSYDIGQWLTRLGRFTM